MEIIIKIYNFLGQGFPFFQIDLTIVNLPTKAVIYRSQDK